MTESQGTLRVADIVARTLHGYQVRHAFGVPGGEVVTLIDALQLAGIDFHLARHETSAATMAAGASTITTHPELLVTTVGPGLANAVNGIADAAQERVPLIVISGIVDRATRARYTHQVIDHAQLLRPLVKASFEIEPQSAASTVARAVALATTEPMGPVHLDLSPDVAAMLAANTSVPKPPTRYVTTASTTDPAVRLLVDRLSKAERPLILAGLEAVRSGAGAALQYLAETIGAPVISTYKAKGIIPENHPLSLGAAGLSPLADRVLLPLAQKADLARIFATKAAWGPHAIIDHLNEIAGAQGLVTVDSGAHRILLSQKWVAVKPLTLLQSAGFCTMNAALPLAIGAQIADPSLRVFAVMGDGGLEMGIGELATVRDLDLPLTIVLFQDRSLALIKMKQASAGLACAGVTLGETDFAAVARGFGGYGVNVENIDDFRNELEGAKGRSGFSLIACRFDASAYDGAF